MQDFNWVWGIQYINLILPDVVIFLKCDDHIASRRSGEHDAERLFDLQDRYEFVLRYGSRCHTGDIYTIDTSDLSQDDVYDRIYKIIEEVMK